MKTYDLIRSPLGDPPLLAFHECLMDIDGGDDDGVDGPATDPLLSVL